MAPIKYDNQGDAISREVPGDALALIDAGGNGSERRYSYGDLFRMSGAVARGPAATRPKARRSRRHPVSQPSGVSVHIPRRDAGGPRGGAGELEAAGRDGRVSSSTTATPAW